MSNEKINEIKLYKLLLDMGFTKVITTPTKLQKLINKFFLNNDPPYKVIEHDCWVEKIINGHKCEIFEMDIWYCRMTYMGQCLFDARRFDNSDLVNLIPKEIEIK